MECHRAPGLVAKTVNFKTAQKENSESVTDALPGQLACGRQPFQIEMRELGFTRELVAFLGVGAVSDFAEHQPEALRAGADFRIA
jgi:hypothetical protein